MITRRNLSAVAFLLGIDPVAAQKSGRHQQSGSTQVLPNLTNGFSLEDPLIPASGIPVVYSTTTANPAWKLSQLSIDHGRLSKWQLLPGPKPRWKATAREATAIIGNNGLFLEQNGTALACDGNREFDLFFSPKNFPQIPVDTAQQIKLIVDADYTCGIAQASVACPVSMSNMTVGFSFTNALTHQTWFYQLHLRGKSLSNKQLVPTGWPDQVTWFSINDPFEADEFVPGGATGPASSHVSIDFDILSRLKAALAIAPTSVPKDQWLMVGFFAGQAIWGNSTTKATWRDIQLWHG